ncbi:MAG: glycoside hydrolase family 65 protein, partial [Anaerolineae bacterium]|nr:glycoside hydrolase family 65 protein [Anaerolineae bacterium]
RETVFTIGNGNFCVRGSFEEGYPGENAASFMHRVWDDMPINFTELANLPRWWGVDIWVNGVRFRLDRGKVLRYRRWLDLRNGVLSRMVRWQPEPAGPVLDLHFERFVNLADPHQAAVQVRVTVVEGQADLRVRMGLNAHVENTGLVHWDLIAQEATPDAVAVQVRTRATKTDLAVAACVHVPGILEVPGMSGESVCDADGQPAVERRATLGAGESVTLQKFIAIVPGCDAADPLAAALIRAQQARTMGYAALRAANDAAWAQTWAVSDVIVEGDIEAQIALRFNVFQLLIAAPRFTDRASIGAKTLSGFGYRHHVFWDTEIFMLPLFSYTQPALARHMLMYRWHNLPGARAKAQGNGYEGAQFPWESGGDGREVTPPWVPHFADPSQLVRIWTGDIEIHITADVAYGVMQYWRITGDDAWMRDYGAEIVLDGAKFWASAARREADGKYHYRNVIGPDEYHDRIDDNAYTN